jgi:hypothetical protein
MAHPREVKSQKLAGQDVNRAAELEPVPARVEEAVEVHGPVVEDAAREDQVVVVADHVERVDRDRPQLRERRGQAPRAAPSPPGPEPLEPENDPALRRLRDRGPSRAHRPRSMARTASGTSRSVVISGGSIPRPVPYRLSQTPWRPASLAAVASVKARFPT